MSLAQPDLDYQVQSFHYGFMDTAEPEALPKGATPDAKNCLYGGLQLQGPFIPGELPQQHVRATLLKRTGARLLTPTAINGAAGFDGLVEFRRVGETTGRLVAVANGKAWYWDNVSAWVQIGATAPFVVGTKARFHTQRGLLFIMDGTSMRAWDGVLINDLFTPGQVAPTAAGALTATAGPGVTGTYEGFQVWYDSVHDHESSPGPLTAQVVFANQTRNWAKPAGAPGANYDKWRVYCRRADTNETYFKNVGDVAIATVTLAEVLTDAARNLRTLGPLPLTNDPPPSTFVVQAEFQGYRLAVVKNDDQVYVSKLGDPQSQHPTDIIGVARGTGGELRSLTKFGTRLVTQKASRTYVLTGDRMPFAPDEIHGSYGNVGASSAIEVKGRFFAWDLNKGPYWTDLAATWVPIGTARIANLVASSSKLYGVDIEAVVTPDKNLVIWSVAQNVIGRRRTLIAYHTELDSWLPPITGLEYAAIVTAVDTNGDTNLFVGDYWGRLYQYFTDLSEGVPSGTLVARVSAGTSGTVTCNVERTANADGTFTDSVSAAAFYTTGGGLMGGPVLHIDAGGGRQWRRIQSNTGSVITLDTTNDSPWDLNHTPVAGDTIVVGGIDFYWRAPLITFGDPFRRKKGGFIMVRAKPGSSSFGLRLVGLLEGFTTKAWTKYFSTFATASAWGIGLWGTMLWGGAEQSGLRRRIHRAFFGFSFELGNPYPNQPVAIVELRITADVLKGVGVASGGG